MKTYFYLLPLLLIFVFACKKKDSSGDQNDQVPENYQADIQKEELKPYRVSLDSIVKKGGGPCITGTDCMEVRAVWPKVYDGEEKIRKIMNDSIYEYVLMNLSFDPDRSETSIEKIADALIADYKIAYEESDGSEMGWAMTVEGEMEFHHNIGALSLLNYSYMGGAHPNYYTTYVNFDTRTGAIISFKDIVKDSAALKTLLEKKFLEEMTAKTGETMSIDDFLFEDGFQFPANFILRKESIEFLYNPYEAAAYVFGETVIDIPYDQLKGLIDLGTLVE